MFSFLQRELPSIGRVFYRGSIPPPLDHVSALACSAVDEGSKLLWSHAMWEAAVAAAAKGDA